jgi:hypothetical protein
MGGGTVYLPPGNCNRYSQLKDNVTFHGGRRTAAQQPSLAIIRPGAGGDDVDYLNLDYCLISAHGAHPIALTGEGCE